MQFDFYLFSFLTKNGLFNIFFPA
uniref:Uncharacterized protein n=1 Tax=Rhizophora mucronata TaxID=61149 RepID=A0A2P2Q9H3_RHIMU